MKKEKVELIITLALAPVMIFIIARNITDVKKKRDVFPRPRARPESVGTGVVPDREEPKRISSLSWGRDPFVFGGAKTAEGDLVLNGIVWDEKNPSAIINGNIVNIGGEINGNIIVDIQRERVIVNKGGATYEMNLRRGGE
ncbi:MAG: hypothetical protein HY589_02575 [Candidatus Omnitrophica bacterium]|nr:hypothetical protein [Candidatus Omnitrophota bacterium]